MRTGEKTRIVGAAVPRKEGVDKLLGRARYVDDITRDGMIFGATVRSTIPRGFIRSITYGHSAGVRARVIQRVRTAPTPPPNLGPLRGPSPQGEGEKSFFVFLVFLCFPRPPTARRSVA